jgi:hypothetical protein
MTQPTAATAKLSDRNDNLQIGDRQAAITAITDSTTGTATNTVNDTTASVKDDIATLAAKINEIINLLEKHGLVADN